LRPTAPTDGRRGGVILLAVVLLPVLLLTAGLAVDGALFYATEGQLDLAVRGAARSASRATNAEAAEAAAQQAFTANFPDGFLAARFREIEVFEYDRDAIRVVGAAEAPTIFLRFLGRETVTIREAAVEQRPGSAAPLRLVADADAFGPDVQDVADLSEVYPYCGGGAPSLCVNADIAGEDVTTPLFSRGRNITPYENVPVHLGRAESPAWFRETDGRLEALSWDELEAAVGKSVCVEVVAGQVEDGEAPASRQGRTAFVVTGLTPAPEREASYPHWLVRLLPSRDVDGYCQATAPTAGE